MLPSSANFVRSRTWPQRREARTTRLCRPHRRRSSARKIRAQRLASIAARLTSGDDLAKTSLLHRGGMARSNHIFLKNERRIFLSQRLDSRISVETPRKFRFFAQAFLIPKAAPLRPFLRRTRLAAAKQLYIRRPRLHAVLAGLAPSFRAMSTGPREARRMASNPEPRDSGFALRARE